MPHGGKIRIETSTFDLAPADLTCTAVVTRRYGVLTVSDSGGGMTPDIKSRIFEPFFTTKPVDKGSGLGLAVVDGIIRQSGGWIDVYSERGDGTSFRLYFPAVDAPVESTTPVQAPSQLGGSETILVAEDEESVRMLASSVLESHGYRVLTADNGTEAVKVAANSSYGIDLLLTDVVMPQMGGRELIEKLQPQFPGMKVLYMSGYTDDAILQYGLEHDAVPFQPKPFTPAALAAQVRRVLDSSL